MTILVTGGAGYIGSHVLKELRRSGEKAVVLDNLSTGHKAAVVHGSFVDGDLSDVNLLELLFREHRFTAVIHLAGSVIVEESVRNPKKYFQNNFENTAVLLGFCKNFGVKHLIFSSTAAVYDDPGIDGICSEESHTNPLTPYGQSKLMAEEAIAKVAQHSSMTYLNLRYFNVVGADPEGEVGPATPQPSGLFPLVSQVCSGKKDVLEIFGDDYPTQDGTGVRDYIHVTDLAQAHLQGLRFLRDGCSSGVMNCGYGAGFSVKEVIVAAEEVMRKKIPFKVCPRRAGDLAKVISDNRKIMSMLQWKPRWNSLQEMIGHTLHWESVRRY